MVRVRVRVRLGLGSGSGLGAPERKVTPGMAGGRQRSSVCTVILAMVAGSDLSGHSTPGTVIEGLRSEPSRRTPLS